MLRKINSWVFTLELSGCGDIYDLFGYLSNVCQKLNLLPFERYDQIMSIVKQFDAMLKAIDHDNCPKNACGHDTIQILLQWTKMQLS